MFSLTRITCIVLCVFVSANVLNANTFSDNFKNQGISKNSNQVQKTTNSLDNYKEEGFNELLNSNKKALKQGKDSISIYKHCFIIVCEYVVGFFFHWLYNKIRSNKGGS